MEVAAAVSAGQGHRTVGLRDALVVLVAPRSVFRRIEDTGAYGLTLFVLLSLMALLGYAQVQTGLVDRAADLNTQKELEQIEKQQAQLVDRVELKEQMENARKGGEFIKLITRLWVIAGAPLQMLVSLMLIAAVFYAAVAMTGRKPEWHTLMSICTYAAVVDVLARGLLLAMMLHYRSDDVSTTLVMLAPRDKPSGALALAAVDPFRVWFWVLIGAGLVVTHQLGRVRATILCTLMCLFGLAANVGVEFLKLS